MSGDVSLEDHFLDRLSVVNKFVDVSDLNEGAAKASLEILRELNLENTHLFPDPDGKVTLCSTQNGKQLYLEVENEEEIYFRLNRTSDRSLINESFQLDQDTCKDQIQENFTSNRNSEAAVW